MPNHIHAIILLVNRGWDDRTPVETHGRASLQSEQLEQSIPSKQFKPSELLRLPKSISSFVAGFKSAVNAQIDNYIDSNHLNIARYNQNNHFFQPNYYDHIIHNNEDFLRIKNYIIQNPFHWDNDKLFL